MTLVQLKHLLALAATGSFSRAADTVFLTQPAFSRSIQALEEELGELLFDRIGKRCELTPYGRTVIASARRIVQSADDLRASSGLLRQGLSGEVRIGLGSGPGAMLMTPLLVYMAHHHPGLTLEIARGHTELLMLDLRNRVLDAVVVDARAITPAEDIHVDKLTEMRGAFMVRKEHPLCTKAGPCSFAELKAYPLASAPLSDEVGRMLVECYGPKALPSRSVTLRCDDIRGLIDTARQTDAVVLGIRAAAPDLVELQMRPPLTATARFAWVTVADRAHPPGLALVRAQVDALLHD